MFISIHCPSSFQNDDTVLTTLGDCDRLAGQLTTVQWARPVVAMATRVTEAATAYLARRFPQVLKSATFKQLGQVWKGRIRGSLFYEAITEVFDCKSIGHGFYSLGV
jgi:hypothetical protein